MTALSSVYKRILAPLQCHNQAITSNSAIFSKTNDMWQVNPIDFNPLYVFHVGMLGGKCQSELFPSCDKYGQGIWLKLQYCVPEIVPISLGRKLSMWGNYPPSGLCTSQTLLLPSENTDNKWVRLPNSYPR